MVKLYRIAGFVVEMDTYGRAEQQAEKYRILEIVKPDIVIDSDCEGVKSRHPSLSDEDAEYLGSGSDFNRKILQLNAMMLHSSAVVVDGKAYMFSAPCGTGKSTHTAIWKNVFGNDKAQILNDDKPVIRKVNGVWYAYGTPWSGKTSQNLNLRVPIAGICLLSRGEKNEIERSYGIATIQQLLMQVPKPKDQASRSAILEILDQLITDIPIWKMKCNMESEAAIVSYEAMSGNKWEGE